MANLKPFRALRPTPESASRVASVPYDVVTTAEVREILARQPDSFLKVVRAEAELPDDAPAEEAHARARANLAAMVADGLLVQESEPSLYVYRLERGDQSQTGVVAAYSLQEYEDGQILKHELTRPAKEADRTRHMRTLEAQVGPVFLTHRSSAALDAAVATITAGGPLFEVAADDGVQHTVWRATDPAALRSAFADVPAVYIADGHHRAAASANARRELQDEGALTPDHPAHTFLGVSFPSDQVGTLPYHRLVLELGGKTREQFLAELRTAVPGQPTDDPHPPAGHAALYTGEGWLQLRLVDPSEGDPVARLVPQALQNKVFGPLLDVTDVRTDPRLEFVGGSRGIGFLTEAVDSGRAALAWSLPAVTTAELLAVADAGRLMPPKSTWFEPKLRSGLFVQPLDPTGWAGAET